MIERALGRLDLPKGSMLFIENVGNLVCPAAFDFGEAARKGEHVPIIDQRSCQGNNHRYWPVAEARRMVTCHCTRWRW